MSNYPPVAEIKDNLEYNPDTGVVSWKLGAFKGKPAGSLSEGYVRIRFKRKQYRAHRIAWVLFYGEWPTQELDHIDGNRSNNAICNLREVTPTQNAQNKHTKRGIPMGVSWHKRTKKWQARVMKDYKSIFLGYFDTVEEASAAYWEAKATHHPHVQLPARR